MDMKERPHRSLTRGRCRKDFHHATASLQPEECRVATQKSYSSSETLKAYDRETHLHYGGCVAELVRHEHQEYVRQASATATLWRTSGRAGEPHNEPGLKHAVTAEESRANHSLKSSLAPRNVFSYAELAPIGISYFLSGMHYTGSFTLAELGVRDQQAQAQAQAQAQTAYHSSHSELGLLQQGYSLSAGSDADSDPEGVMSPERTVQLWGGHAIKSRRSSGLSSRANSALTLTDSDNEHKSDDESGRTEMGGEIGGGA
ncbi:unnamed protein product [Coregonus sp. 'balchen']|nr:unnamed protein product [Coregonus sp. 'balchen']